MQVFRIAVGLALSILCSSLVPSRIGAQESQSTDLFSGPQIGERLEAFACRGVYESQAGKELDVVKQAAGQPLVLVFVHELSRPSIAFTRTLAKYSASRHHDGLKTGIIWLSDDMTDAESTLNRVRHALVPSESSDPDPAAQKAGQASYLEAITVAMSVDGREGPGSYGLNRNVALTVLVAKDNKVVGNWALVQPSLPTDLPKVLDCICRTIGGTAPKVDELLGPQAAMQARSANAAEALNLRPLLAQLIRKNASQEQVEAAAEAIKKRASEEPAVRREVARIANTIIKAGKLENYGTQWAQDYLTLWSKEFADESGRN